MSTPPLSPSSAAQSAAPSPASVVVPPKVSSVDRIQAVELAGAALPSEVTGAIAAPSQHVTTTNLSLIQVSVGGSGSATLEPQAHEHHADQPGFQLKNTPAYSKVKSATRVELGLESPMSCVNCDLVPETWWIGQYPKVATDYWNWICEGDLSMGIQLHQAGGKFPSYHTEVGESRVLPTHIVTLESMDDSRGFTHRRYQIMSLADSSQRSYDHLELPWVNFGIPDLDSSLAMLSSYRDVVARYENPQVHVHCIGGKGRSGTFVYARCLTQAEGEKSEDLLSGLRSQRHHLVENEGQDAFAQRLASQFKADF